MDYDDNDVHSQNFHLAGEGSTQFPPGLQRYALPKFDFDDSHLRFDSLVETEVFLGIESNQDNHWIEDFSRGGSEIEFNSSAADPCSISRRNNVWSEATSSESVEMLLKSVGQEEVIGVPTIIEESDACNELEFLTKQMEQNLKSVENVVSKPGDVKALGQTLPQDVIAGNSSGSKEDVVEDQFSIVNASQIQAGEDFARGISNSLDQSADKEKSALRLNEEGIFADIGCDDVTKRGVNDLTDQHLYVQTQEEPFGDLATPVPNIVATTNEFSNEAQLQTNDGSEKLDDRVSSEGVGMDSQNVDGNVVHTPAEKLIHSISEVPTFSESSVEASRTNVEEPSSAPLESADIRTDGGSGKDESLRATEASKGDDVAMQEDTPVLGGPVETLTVESRSENDQIPSILEPKIDFTESKSKNDVLECEQQLVSENLVAIPDIVGSSGDNASIEIHVPAATVVPEPALIVEKDKAYVETGVHVCKKETPIVLNDASNMDIDSPVLEVGSSSSDPGKADNELNGSTMQHATAGGSESDVAITDSNLVSHAAISEDVPLPSGDGVAIRIDQKSSQISLPVDGSNQLEVTEEALTKTFAESSVSSSTVSSKVEAGPDSVSLAEEGGRCDTSGLLSCSTVDESLPSVSRLVTETLIKAPDSTLDKVSEEFVTQTREGDVTAAAVFSNMKAIVDKVVPEDSAKALEPTSSKEEMLAQNERSLEKSQDSSQKVQEDSETTRVIEDKNPRQTVESNIRSDGNSSADQSLQIPASELSQIASLDNGRSFPVQIIPIPGPPKLSQITHGVEGVKDPIKHDASISQVTDDKAKKNPSNSRASKALNITSEGKTGSSRKSSKGGGRKNLLPLPVELGPRIVEGSPSHSLPGQLDPKIVQEIPQASPQVPEAEVTRGRPKSTSERKPRRSSVRATGKDSAKKGTQPKETMSAKQPETSNNVPLSPAIFHVMQSNEMQPYGHIDVNNNKPYFLLAASTSGLPDLNTSTSPSTVFHQPFTDFQQVQLRAQIFIYGALMQGTPPEEAYMLAAFGGLDGGKSIWGNAWQVSIDRLQGQQSTHIYPETPSHSSLGTASASRTVDQVSKQSAIQNIGISTPVGRSTVKSSQTVASPMIPHSSPLWSMATPVADTMQSGVMPRGSVIDYQQAFASILPFQTPPLRNLLGNNASWMPHPSYRGPWVSSPQPSVPEASARFSAFPPTEPVQLTPVKETSVSKHVPPGPTVQTGTPASVFTAASPLIDLKKATPSHGQQPTDPKPRKRKKSSAPEEIAQIVQQPQPQVQPMLASAVKTPAPLFSQPTPERPALPLAKTPLPDGPPRAILSEESLGNIKDASKQAEDATALAASAVSHSEEIWSQLEKQKNSGSVSDPEAKLASAVVAVTAAAAVARAAAAAANVAANAAFQAKLMAEEAFFSNSFGIPGGQSTRIPSSESGSSASGNSSSSILTAAREAARKNVEAASAASKRAENMDAIVKAAELAAEAVSQAGKIVAMGDPLPLSELIRAGPEGYWRAPQVPPELPGQSTEPRELSKPGGVGDVTYSTRKSRGGRSVKKGTPIAASEKLSVSRVATTTELADEHLRLADGASGSVAALQKEAIGHKGFSDLTKNIVVVLESEPTTKSFSFNAGSEVENAVQIPEGSSIKEGSKVEVFKVGDGFKAAWYTATVLNLNDGKACVAYTEIESDEGEWVAIACEGDNPPKIRIARPVTTLQYEGTRKRRRAAMGDYNWNVGDRVDAWMNNSWWEGVVMEKNKKDETSVTVHFPAQSETSTVKAWHLRPSLKWNDGEWVEWSNLPNNSSLQEGDTPQEKRLKLGSPVEVKGKEKTSSKASDALDSAKPEEPRLLELTGVDRAFNIGKSSKTENKPDSTRMVRTGLQKEGSRVVFGVPKPGKKRKFMDVSKHYVADQSNKNDEPSDSIKHLKYSAQGSRSLRNDPKEKRVAESKLKGLKPGKQQTAFGRTVPQKNFPASSVSISGDGASDLLSKLKESKPNPSEDGSLSNPEVATDGPFVFSAGPTSGGSSSKRAISSAKPDRANRGKLAPAGRKLGKIEEEKVYHNDAAKSTSSEAVEPRRSNRRIQPTSRLLEGLQSSLILPKFPSFSHDKGQRSQSKSTPRGNNRG